MSRISRPRSRKIIIDNDSEDLFSVGKSPAKATPKKKKGDHDIINDKSIFGELVTKSGFILKKGNQPNTLKCDQSVFQRDLQKSLLFHPQHQKEELITRFIDGLEEHIQDYSYFKWALLYTQTAANSSSCHGAQQDSLIRLLLNLDPLQPRLVSLLTEKLLQVAYDEDESEASNLPCLILANLRWLDHVVDPAALKDKVIELLQGTPKQIQREVINFLPNIVDDDHHPQIATVLSELYHEEASLTSTILDSLSYLSLEEEDLEDIHHVVLKSLRATSKANLPVVLKFLLHNVPQGTALQVIGDIRDNIVLPGQRKSMTSLSQAVTSQKGLSMTSQKRPPVGQSAFTTSQKGPAAIGQSGDEDLEMLVFSNIKVALLVNKYLAKEWLKCIRGVDAMASVVPLDVVMLIVLHDLFPPRRRDVESILRNMVRKGVADHQHLLTNTFLWHSSVLKEYFESVKKIADTLLRSSDPAIANFGFSIYQCCFVHLGGHHERDVMLCLLSHLGDAESVRQGALNLISALATKHTIAMSKYTVFMKGSLDLLERMQLREAKQLMDAILLLAHAEGGESEGLRDEMAILIRKQIAHSDIKFKRLGVLGAVLTLKNSGGGSGSPLREAEELFHMVKESTARAPLSAALFMDELATNVLKNGLNSRLGEWISEKVIGDFEDKFVVECQSEAEGNFPFEVTYQWNLDDVTDSEQARAIAVGIAKFVQEQRNGGSSVIVTLAPHFRLLRMMECQLHEGSLDNIDALLGCSLQLPSPAVFEGFSSLDDSQQCLALSCLFYVINWLRELVNAFATQKDPDLKRRVILRLKKLISLQDLLARLLPLKPAFEPPPAVFDCDVTLPSPPSAGGNAPGGSGAKKGPKKGVKRKRADDLTQLTLTSPSQPSGTRSKTVLTQTQKGQAEGVSVAKPSYDGVLQPYKSFFRELHLDAFNLLFRNLSLDSELDLEENVKYLFPREAEFLLSDMNQKLSRVFEAKEGRRGPPAFRRAGGADKDAGFSHFDVFSPEEVAEEAVRYVKPICAHLEKISAFFQDLMSEADEIEDAPALFTAHTTAVSRLCTTLLTTLRSFLGWHALRNPQQEQRVILKNALRLLCRTVESDRLPKMSLEDLVAASFGYLKNFGASVVSIATAAELVALLGVIAGFSDRDLLRKEVVSLADHFLKKEWYTLGANRDKGGSYNRCIHALLKALFDDVSDPVASIHGMASTSLLELSRTGGKDPSAELYPTMKKSTLPVYYSILLSNLVSGTSKLLSASPHPLEVWNASIKTLHALVEPLKQFSTTAMFAPCLKYCHKFLELFVLKGMPTMDSSLLTKQAEVTAILKNLQISTRFLQHLCTHVKASGDARLVPLVPSLKRSLEAVVYRVKVMLARNQCQEAFWMGNLKNRDLKGQELLSQTQQQDDDDSDADGEGSEGGGVPAEDDLSDVLLDDEEDSSEGPPQTSAAREESYSITY